MQLCIRDCELVYEYPASVSYCIARTCARNTPTHLSHALETYVKLLARDNTLGEQEREQCGDHFAVAVCLVQSQDYSAFNNLRAHRILVRAYV